jgi:hypothetical protein
MIRLKIEHNSLVTSMIGKRSWQDVLRATYFASIVDNTISVCSVLFHSTGQSTRHMT